MIHQTAIIHPSSQLHDSVEVGPYSIIGKNVEIDEGTIIGPHVVINGPSKIGKHNHIYQFTSIGEDTQDKKGQGNTSALQIGDHNIIREFATIHRGTEQGGGITRVGSHNLFMAYTHVAHDCQVGSHCCFSNNATLGGHVKVNDYANLAGFAAVHQFCEVGSHSFIAKASMVTKDVLPYLMVDGNPPTTHGLNVIGLQRRQFSDELISILKKAYKIIFRQGLTTKQALDELADLRSQFPEVAAMCVAIESSARGIVR